jgi:hypothetical protein
VRLCPHIIKVSAIWHPRMDASKNLGSCPGPLLFLGPQRMLSSSIMALLLLGVQYCTGSSLFHSSWCSHHFLYTPTAVYHTISSYSCCMAVLSGCWIKSCSTDWEIQLTQSIPSNPPNPCGTTTTWWAVQQSLQTRRTTQALKQEIIE